MERQIQLGIVCTVVALLLLQCNLQQWNAFSKRITGDLLSGPVSSSRHWLPSVLDLPASMRCQGFSCPVRLDPPAKSSKPSKQVLRTTTQTKQVAVPLQLPTGPSGGSPPRRASHRRGNWRRGPTTECKRREGWTGAGVGRRRGWVRDRDE
jgi:hypothetical protein